MGNIGKLDDKGVNTDRIISVYTDYFTKFIDQDPMLLDNAIKFIDKFLLEPTPKYKKEPKIDGLGHVTFPGEEQKYLHQFWYENIDEFTEKTRVIDSAMKVIPTVIMEIRRQLKELQQNNVPMNLPFAQKSMEQKEPSWGEQIKEKLGLRTENNNISSADLSVESMINYIFEVRNRWGIWKEWYFGSIKYENNRGTWSDINSRSGMEFMLSRMHEFFNYWIITRFMPVYQYAVDYHLGSLMKDTGKFVDSLARQQHESEQLNQNKPNI